MKKIIGILLLSAVAFWGISDTKDAHAEGYGMAGCGLGSLVIKDNTIMQVFAATTNGTSYSQLFGITSGTSNCAAGTGTGTSAAKKFIQTNRVVMAKDISRGRGETIATLAAMGGCSNTKMVGAKLQRSFNTIFPDASVNDVRVSSNIVNVLKDDKSLSCTKLN